MIQTKIKSDWLLAILASTLVLALGSLPTWMGAAAQDEALIFRGLYFDEQDYSVHIAMMQAGSQGEWAYQLRFTSEPHRPAYVRMFYVVLGHVSNWLGLAPETAYHLARWLFGYCALLAIYGLFKRAFDELRWVWAAFVLATLGAGLGWLQLMTGWLPGRITPIDFWLIDAYVFFSLSIFPHFAFCIALMVASIILYLDFLRSGSWKNIFGIALSAVLVQATNPIAFIVADTAFVGATVFHGWQAQRFAIRQIGALGVIAAAQLPLFIYNLTLLNGDPVWTQYTAQNLTLSPPPAYYLWGFGLLWPFALLGAASALHTRAPSQGAALAWVVAGFVLAYSPFNIQRRFLLAIVIPLALLATHGLITSAKFLSVRKPVLSARRHGLAFACVVFASISSIYLSLGSSLFMQTRPPEYFYPAELDRALIWLKANAAPEDFVLSRAETGQLIAQRAGLRVFLGHEMETLHFEEKLVQVESFYNGDAPADWLTQAGVDWVIYGPYEQQIAPGFQPPARLRLAYRAEGVFIYEFK